MRKELCSSPHSTWSRRNLRSRDGLRHAPYSSSYLDFLRPKRNPWTLPKVGLDRGASRLFWVIAISIGLSPFLASASNEDQGKAVQYDYDADIAPILDQYCVKCHGPDEQKSRYRLDTYERLLTPGSSDGQPIIPYSPMESPLLEYLLMPGDDEYHMPPEDEDQPNAEDIIKIARWIYYGATNKTAVAATLALEELLDKNQLVALKELRENGGIIQKLGKSKASLLVDLQQFSGSNLNQLTKLPSIEELRMTGLGISSGELEIVQSLSSLKLLDGRNSNADDEWIVHINQLGSLEYLNLFGTQLTDTGLNDLNLPVLKKLYVGDTRVTQQGIEQFKHGFPEIEIYGSVDLKAVLQITEDAKSNSTTFNPENPAD